MGGVPAPPIRPGLLGLAPRALLWAETPGSSETTGKCLRPSPGLPVPHPTCYEQRIPVPLLPAAREEGDLPVSSGLIPFQGD